MFGWFRKKEAVPVPKVVNSAPAERSPRNTDHAHWDAPMSLPEVTEGNSDADWSAWEESIAFLSNEVHASPSHPTAHSAGPTERN